MCAQVPQKTTNMVHDIEGTAPGTGGLGGCAIKMYRKQKQVAIGTGDLGAISERSRR